MSDAAKKERENHNLTLKLLGFALGSFAFGFALVPFYNVLCEVTGFGDQRVLTQARAPIGVPVDTRTITVDFVAVLSSVGNW